MRSKHLFVPLVAISLAVSGFCVAASSASDRFAVNGKVVDSSTGKPVRDVTVVIEWRAATLHGGRLCQHAEVVTTGENGEFLLSPAGYSEKAFVKHLGGGTWYVYVILYKQGYDPLFEVAPLQKRWIEEIWYGSVGSVSVPRHSVLRKNLSSQYVVTPFRGTPEERVEKLFDITGSVQCMGDGANNYSGNLVPFYEQTIAEASSHLASIELKGISKSYRPGWSFQRYREAKVGELDSFRSMVKRMLDRLRYARDGINSSLMQPSGSLQPIPRDGVAEQ